MALESLLCSFRSCLTQQHCFPKNGDVSHSLGSPLCPNWNDSMIIERITGSVVFLVQLSQLRPDFIEGVVTMSKTSNYQRGLILVGVVSFFKSDLACWTTGSFLRRRHISRVILEPCCTGLGLSSHWDIKTNKKGARMARRQKSGDYYVQWAVSAATSWVRLWWRRTPSRQIAGLRQDSGVGVPCNYIIAHLALCRNVNFRMWASNGGIQPHSPHSTSWWCE